MSKFEIDATPFGKASKAIAGFETAANRALEAALRKAGQAVRKSVRAEAKPHRRTGKLSKGIRLWAKGRGRDATVTVKSTGPVAHLIVGGVKPHAITQPYKRGNATVMALHAPGKAGGVTGFAKTVEHPGFGADPYFKRGVDASRDEVNRILATQGDLMAKQLAKQIEKAAR